MQLVPTGDLLASAQQAVEAWSPLAAHPNLVVPRHAFVSAEIDATPALFLVHELHPAAVRVPHFTLQSSPDICKSIRMPIAATAP